MIIRLGWLIQYIIVSNGKEEIITIIPIHPVHAALDDFTTMRNVLVFTFIPGVNELCTSEISIIDDLVLEDNETFSILLSTTDLDVSLEPSSASVTIVDNDSKGVLYPLVSGVIMQLFISSQTLLWACNNLPTL